MNCGSADDVVRMARAWLGTPYCHRASRRGVGCDCLGLIRGVWRERVGREPEALPDYGAGWAEMMPDERLWHGLSRHLRNVPRHSALSTGQVILFRMRDRAAARHLGILSSMGSDGAISFIHAYEKHGVIESPLSVPWRRRIVARFELD